MDRLKPGIHLSLKVASVMGQWVDLDILHKFYPINKSKEELRAHLQELERGERRCRRCCMTSSLSPLRPGPQSTPAHFSAQHAGAAALWPPPPAFTPALHLQAASSSRAGPSRSVLS